LPPRTLSPFFILLPTILVPVIAGYYHVIGTGQSRANNYNVVSSLYKQANRRFQHHRTLCASWAGKAKALPL
jgi:hypothetical protein